MNLANKITTFRIVMVGVIILVMLFPYKFVGVETIPYVFGNVNVVYFVALILFLIAAISDAIDGHIARKYDMITDLGKFLDPIADKLLVNILLVILLVPDLILPGVSDQMKMPILPVVIMIGRDLIIDGLRLVAANKNKVLAANVGGKIKTILQMIAIPLVLLNNWPFSLIIASETFNFASLFVYLAALASLISGIVYLVQNYHILKEEVPHEG